MPKGGCSDETSGVAGSECGETVVGGSLRGAASKQPRR